MRFFQTGGPCVPRRHYMVPAGDWLPGARDMIARDEYFVVHAPRQSGKTTSLEALAQELTGAGTSGTATSWWRCAPVIPT